MLLRLLDAADFLDSLALLALLDFVGDLFAFVAVSAGLNGEENFPAFGVVGGSAKSPALGGERWYINLLFEFGNPSLGFSVLGVVGGGRKSSGFGGDMAGNIFWVPCVNPFSTLFHRALIGVKRRLICCCWGVCLGDVWIVNPPPKPPPRDVSGAEPPKEKGGS